MPSSVATIHLCMDAERASGCPRWFVLLSAGTRRDEDLCYRAELDDEIIREIFWCNRPTFLLPRAGEPVLIITHDDSRIRAAYEVAAVIGVEPDDVVGRIGAICLNYRHRYLLRKNKRLPCRTA